MTHFHGNTTLKHWNAGTLSYPQDDFLRLFHGNTSDFSASILRGFVIAVKASLGIELSSDELELLWRFCDVHYHIKGMFPVWGTYLSLSQGVRKEIGTIGALIY